MEIDVHTQVASLLAAIPSSANIFNSFGIKLDGNEYKTVAELCRDNGVDLGEFLDSFDKIDWEAESA